MTDKERLYSMAAWSKLLDGEHITGNDMKRIIGPLQDPGIQIYAASPDEMAGLRASLISTLQNWMSAIQEQ